MNQPMNHAIERREAGEPAPNPLGIEGIEWVEYRTRRPQALGQVLEMMGFAPVGRHRSREVLLYRQGDMNVVVNGHDAEGAPADDDAAPQLVAVGLRVRDAAGAWARAVDGGAWPVPSRVAVMELNIPAVHGPGATRWYFIDRWREFSIWDVDFVPIPGVDRRPPTLGGLHWFGVVQYIGHDRMDDWLAFYQRLFGFEALAAGQHFGILPRGRILASPCGSFHLQLIEPPSPDVPGEDEGWQRMGLGAADVPAAVAALRARGVGFVERSALHPQAQGALTEPWLGGLMFELVQARGGQGPGGTAP